MAVKKKFYEIDIPLVSQKADVYTDDISKIDGRVVKIDLTRQLRGKSMEAHFKLKVKGKRLKMS